MSSWKVVAAAVLVILCGAGLWALREQQIADAPLLPLHFDHADHRDVNCATCHHNFIDNTGDGRCLQCHKNDPAIAGEIQPMFHDLCRGCHVKKQHAGLDAGPTRACSGCHGR